MSPRFSPVPLFFGHWKTLSVPAPNLKVKGDVVSRIVLLGAPVALTVLAFVGSWDLKTPSAVLGGTSLLAGGLLAAFGQIAAWRARVSDQLGDYELSDKQILRLDSIDETASHLLVAAYLAGVEALLIVLGLNASADKLGNVTGVLAALSFGVGSYLALLFLLTVPRLYAAYVDVYSVRRELSGLDG